jgi:peptidoglycan/xylan/chitin deacetylase (PgdA/CDA1 family)
LPADCAFTLFNPRQFLAEDVMRFVVIIVVALMSLGLAAFGVVSAQKTAFSSGPAIADTSPHVVTASPTVDAPRRRTPVDPVSQIAQATGSPAAATSAAPSLGPTPLTRIAQTTAAATPAPAAPSAPGAAGLAPDVSTANKSASTIPPCDKPGGMGLARVVEIDTTGGPGFGVQHFKQYDFLRDKEVVLTFDDGPWPENTPAVLKALADQCLKATFFEIGKHAMWHPAIAKQVVEAGMTLGTHTWSHKDLARKPYATELEQAEREIELGVSAVHAAVGVPVAPFFRFPDLQHPPQLMAYLAERDIAVFSTDIDSRDFKMHKPEQVIKSVMDQLDKRGKGIILMHDFKRATGEAMPELLQRLKAGGYKVVHMVPKGTLATLPKYDEMLAQEDKLSSNNTRPENSVVRTIGE